MTHKQIIKKLEKDYGWSNTKTFNALHQQLIKDVSKIVHGQLDAQVKQLPPIFWEYEDELPEMTDEEFDGAFVFSQIRDGARMYPYMEINGVKHYLRSN